jgi:protein-L-isoaspartate(D-aspartate) O-methyltransferase
MGTDYQDARQKMVDNQIRTTDVTSHSVLKAFLTVAREDFVPTPLKPLAYIDTISRLPLAETTVLPVMSWSRRRWQRCFSWPQINRDQVVLEIGCGSGYTAAHAVAAGGIRGCGRKRCGARRCGERETE